MIKLSDRLQIMADNILPGESVLDVGTDHGYLPIYLYENKISDKIILSDISKDSLNKAKENIDKLLGESSMDLRLGNGLSVLTNSEVDDIVIAGMGGLLISEILEDNPVKSKSFKKYILEPRNHVGDLRKFLYYNDFEITDELLVREGRFICEIIVCKPSEFKQDAPNFIDGKIEWEVPETLLKYRSNLLVPYINRKINTEKNILSKVSESNKDLSIKKVRITQIRIDYLNNLLGKLL